MTEHTCVECGEPARGSIGGKNKKTNYYCDEHMPELAEVMVEDLGGTIAEYEPDVEIPELDELTDVEVQDDE